MKNKVIIATVVLLVLVAVGALAYILLNTDTNPNISGNNTVVQNSDSNEDIQQNTNENTNKEEEQVDNGQKVTVDSRRGLEILESLDFVSNMYSNLFYDELDSNGISNRAKIIAAYIKIATQDEYASLLKQDDERVYFSKSDLEKVVKDTFASSTQIIHTSIIGEDSYIADKGEYVLPSIGFSTLDYTIDVPYKIVEYNDRVEVTSYRVYISSVVNTDNDLEITVTDNIYYDRAMLEEAIVLENGDISNALGDYERRLFIRKKIDSKELDESKLTFVKYTLSKVGDKLLISDYKKGV